MIFLENEGNIPPTPYLRTSRCLVTVLTPSIFHRRQNFSLLGITNIVGLDLELSIASTSYKAD